jgi:hypothetical protein
MGTIAPNFYVCKNTLGVIKTPTPYEQKHLLCAQNHLMGVSGNTYIQKHLNVCANPLKPRHLGIFANISVGEVISAPIIGDLVRSPII